MESKKKIPEPEITSSGKFKCKAHDNEYDSREDYNAHCSEEHSEM